MPRAGTPVSGGGRLFIAVDVGDAIRAEVTRICAEIDAKVAAAPAPPRISWVAAKSVHVTLRFLGETSGEELARVRRALEPPIAQSPFAVEWRGLGAFPGPRHPRALWIGVVNGAAALGALEAEVSRRLDGTEARETEPFRPHITLGRVKTAGSGVDWAKVLEKIEMRGVTSAVDHVTLYRSELTARGPNYTGLVKAPLVGA